MPSSQLITIYRFHSTNTKVFCRINKSSQLIPVPFRNILLLKSEVDFSPPPSSLPTPYTQSDLLFVD